jgi:hypothetical protein
MYEFTFPVEKFDSCPASLDKTSDALWEARWLAAKDFLEEAERSYETKEGVIITIKAAELVVGTRASVWLPAPFRSWSASDFEACEDADVLELIKVQEEAVPTAEMKAAAAVRKASRKAAGKAAAPAPAAKTPGSSKKRARKEVAAPASSSKATPQHSEGEEEEDAVLAAFATAREGYEAVRIELADTKSRLAAAFKNNSLLRIDLDKANTELALLKASAQEGGGAGGSDAAIALLKEQLAAVQAENKKLMRENISLEMKLEAAQESAKAGSLPATQPAS